MTTQSPAEAIFFAALDKPAGPEREAYLADACRDDDDLRRLLLPLLCFETLCIMRCSHFCQHRLNRESVSPVLW